MKAKVISIAIIVTALVAIMVMQGCSTAKQPTLNDLGGQWVLKTINGKEASSLFSRNLPTFQFNFNEKTISGTGGCNRYTGRFILINNLLKAPDIASTRMFCMEPNAEDEFFEALRKDNVLIIQDGILKMKNGKNIVLEFEKASQNEPKGQLI